MSTAVKIALAAVLLLAAAAWWLFLDARAPRAAEGIYDLAHYRALTDGDAPLPQSVRMEIIGTDTAPMYGVEAGGGFGGFPLVYAAFQIVSPAQRIVIGGALDALTAAEIAQSNDAMFDDAAYARLLAAIETADMTMTTHEHLDHVMAITRHPRPGAIVDRLRLTAPQIDALPRFAPEGGLDPAFASLAPFTVDGPTKIAPGVVAIPTPGHTPGSLCFYVRTADGREYLMIGDIVWAMSNIDNLKTRPRILQYLFFDPDEDRKAVLAQVRALHDLAKAHPDLVMLPEHDGAHLRALLAQGALHQGFE